VASENNIFKGKCFPITSLCKTDKPWGGAIFWPVGHSLNKLDKGSLGVATVLVLSKLEKKRNPTATATQRFKVFCNI